MQNYLNLQLFSYTIKKGSEKFKLGRNSVMVISHKSKNYDQIEVAEDIIDPGF